MMAGQLEPWMAKKSAHYEHTIGLTEEGTRVFTENLF